MEILAVEEEKRNITFGMYVIFDKLAEEGGPVFEAKNDQVARRAYRQMLKQNKVENIEEYHLYKVGIIDRETLEVRVERRKINIEFGKMEEEDE